MKLVALKDIFDIKHGTKLDFNKTIITNNNGINFVSRTSQRLGVIDKIEYIDGLTPLSAGLITISLGGSYLLSAFVQQEPFYTGQNIKILDPKITMDFKTKVFYCMCIAKNRFKYTSHGREANRTLDEILVPSINSIPKWIANKQKIAPPSCRALIDKGLHISLYEWKKFKLRDLFEFSKGDVIIDKCEEGIVPLISSTSKNNGISSYVNSDNIINENVITLAVNGSIGECFYQPLPFCATTDIAILLPKFHLTPYVALFLCTVIKMEKFRFNYGRKWNMDRLERTVIKLPALDNEPYWQFMENYVKSLPYSINLQQEHKKLQADKTLFETMLKKASIQEQ